MSWPNGHGVSNAQTRHLDEFVVKSINWLTGARAPGLAATSSCLIHSHCLVKFLDHSMSARHFYPRDFALQP